MAFETLRSHKIIIMIFSLQMFAYTNAKRKSIAPCMDRERSAKRRKQCKFTKTRISIFILFFLHLQRVSFILCLMCISSTRSFTIFFSIRYLFPWKLRPCKAIAVDRSNNFLQHERKMLARDNTSFLRFAENLRILWDTNLIPKIEFQRMASMKHYTKFISLWFSHKCSSGLEFFYWIFLTCTKEEKKKLNRRRRMEYHNVEFTQHTSTAPLAM